MANHEVTTDILENAPRAPQDSVPGAPVHNFSPPTEPTQHHASDVLGADALPAGTELHGGAFRISRVLGQDDIGITYLSRNVALHRDVVIKEFFPLGASRAGSILGDDDISSAAHTVVPPERDHAGAYQRACSAFSEKSRAVSRVWHPNVVMVYDTFEEHNTAYMVMKLLKGRTLQRLLEEQPETHALPQAQALAYAIHIGRGIEAMHKAGLTHGDVHPTNVMLCPPVDSKLAHVPPTAERRAPLPPVPTGEWTLAGERVVLLDCGLNCLPDSNSFQPLRPADREPGSRHSYAPIEVFEGNCPTGPAGDVYALGATLYHLLTGQAPVDAQLRAQGSALQPPHHQDARISPSLSEAVMWAMELRSEHRPHTMEAFLKHLSQCDNEAAQVAEPQQNVTPARKQFDTTRVPTPIASNTPAIAATPGYATENVTAPLPGVVPGQPTTPTWQPMAPTGMTPLGGKGRHLALTALLGITIAGATAWALWQEGAQHPRPAVQNLPYSKANQRNVTERVVTVPLEPQSPPEEQSPSLNRNAERPEKTVQEREPERRVGQRRVAGRPQRNARVLNSKPFNDEASGRGRAQPDENVTTERERRVPTQRRRRVVRQWSENGRDTASNDTDAPRDKPRSFRSRRSERRRDETGEFTPRRRLRTTRSAESNAVVRRRFRRVRREAGLPPLPGSPTFAPNRSERRRNQTRSEAGLPPL